MADTPKTHITYANVRFWLPVIVMIASLALTWGMWTMRLAGIEQDVAVHEIKIEANVEKFTDIQVQLGEMSRDIRWIRERLDEK